MPTANHTISSNRSRQRSKASLLAPDSPHRSKALGELQTPNTRTQEGMPSTPSLRSRGRAAHLSPFPASRRPDLVHFHGGTPSPGAAGVAAANGAGRRSDPPAALPAEPQREAGEALPGPGAARRRAESPLLHGPKTRGAGAGEAGSAQSASGRSTAVATAPPASPWRASNATFPGAEGSGPPNLLAPPGFPGPAGPGAPTPTPTPRAGPGSEANPLSSPAGCPPTRARRGPKAGPSRARRPCPTSDGPRLSPRSAAGERRGAARRARGRRGRLTLRRRGGHPGPVSPPPPIHYPRVSRAIRPNVSPSGSGEEQRPRFAQRRGTALVEGLTALPQRPPPPPPSWPPLREGCGRRAPADGYTPLPSNLRPAMPFRAAQAPPSPGHVTAGRPFPRFQAPAGGGSARTGTRQSAATDAADRQRARRGVAPLGGGGGASWRRPFFQSGHCPAAGRDERFVHRRPAKRRARFARKMK